MKGKGSIKGTPEGRAKLSVVKGAGKLPSTFVPLVDGIFTIGSSRSTLLVCLPTASQNSTYGAPMGGIEPPSRECLSMCGLEPHSSTRRCAHLMCHGATLLQWAQHMNACTLRAMHKHSQGTQSRPDHGQKTSALTAKLVLPYFPGRELDSAQSLPNLQEPETLKAQTG